MFGKKKNLAPLEPDRTQRIVARAIENARDYVEVDVAPQRRRADQYYQGFTSVKAEEGRSKIVVTRVRDAVKSVIPSLARVFTQSDTIAESGQPASRNGQRVRIAIQSDQPQPGKPVQEPLCMATGTQRGIDKHRTGSIGCGAGQRWGE